MNVLLVGPHEKIQFRLRIQNPQIKAIVKDAKYQKSNMDYCKEVIYVNYLISTIDERK